MKINCTQDWTPRHPICHLSFYFSDCRVGNKPPGHVWVSDLGVSHPFITFEPKQDSHHCFLTSISYDSFFIHWNATDLCILILYLATLLIPFICSNSVLVVSLGFSICSITSSVNSDDFISSFSMWIRLISFPHLIAVVRTSNIMLNRSGERRHPCLVWS